MSKKKTKTDHRNFSDIPESMPGHEKYKTQKGVGERFEYEGTGYKKRIDKEKK